MELVIKGKPKIRKRSKRVVGEIALISHNHLRELCKEINRLAKGYGEPLSAFNTRVELGSRYLRVDLKPWLSPENFVGDGKKGEVNHG